MNQQKLNEKYICYVQQCITAQQPVMTFDEWHTQYLIAQDAEQKFVVRRYSNATKAFITFNLSAHTLTEANKQADDLISKFELKHSLEVGKGGKILTPQEQRELMIKKANQFLDKQRKQHDRNIKQAQKFAAELMRLGIPINPIFEIKE